MRRPYVLLNVAATVDGKIDTFERKGAVISSDSDRQRVDVLRASVDAIVVGGRTLLDEDPRLLVRSPELRAERVRRGVPENPAKVGIVSRPVFKPGARFLAMGPARIILFTPAGALAAESLRDQGVEIFAMGEQRVDLRAAFGKLSDLGVERVLVEGGGTLNFELVRLGLVDEVQIFVAPLILGGAGAPTLADGPGLLRDVAVRLTRVEVEVAEDGGVLLRYKVDHRE